MGNHENGRHLASSIHDVICSITETWCGGPTQDATEDIDRATCTDCLHAAVDYGSKAQDRLIELQRERMAARKKDGGV